MPLARIVAGFATVAVVVLSVGAADLSAQGWRSLVPGVTSEEEVVRVYGEPPNVVIRFVGFDAFQSWRRGTPVPRYDFEYFLGGPIHSGPLGEAHRAVVAFDQRNRIFEVQWTYQAGLRLHRATGEPPTRISPEQIERILGDTAVVTKRSGRGFALSIYRFKNDLSVLEVEYSGEGSDIEVHLSRQGIYPLP